MNFFTALSVLLVGVQASGFIFPEPDGPYKVK